MPKDWIELKSLKISLDDLLKIVTKAIKEHYGIKLSERFKLQKNNNIKLLRWLVDQNVIEIEYISSEKGRKSTPTSIKSRQRKIEICIQLHALGAKFPEIAQKFGVKENTARGYLKDLTGLKPQFLQILREILYLKNISTDGPLQNYPNFPIYISAHKLKESLRSRDSINLDEIVNQDKFLNLVSGRNLGSFDVEILLPMEKII